MTAKVEGGGSQDAGRGGRGRAGHGHERPARNSRAVCGAAPGLCGCPARTIQRDPYLHADAAMVALGYWLRPAALRQNGCDVRGRATPRGTAKRRGAWYFKWLLQI